MLTLMLGGLALTSTGFYLALRRIRNDIALLPALSADASPRLPKKAILEGLMAVLRNRRPLDFWGTFIENFPFRSAAPGFGAGRYW